MNNCGNCASLRRTIEELRKQLSMSDEDELIDALGAWNAGVAAGDMIRKLQGKVKELGNALITTHEVGRRVILALGLELPVSDDPPAGDHGND